MVALRREVNSADEDDAQTQTDTVSSVSDPRGAQVTGKGRLAQALREEKTEGRGVRRGAGKKGSGGQGQEMDQRTTSGPRKGGGREGGGRMGREAGS